MARPHKGRGALEGEENPFTPWPSALSVAGITLQRAEPGREGLDKQAMGALLTIELGLSWAAQCGEGHCETGQAQPSPAPQQD